MLLSVAFSLLLNDTSSMLSLPSIDNVYRRKCRWWRPVNSGWRALLMDHAWCRRDLQWLLLLSSTSSVTCIECDASLYWRVKADTSGLTRTWAASHALFTVSSWGLQRWGSRLVTFMLMLISKDGFTNGSTSLHTADKAASHTDFFIIFVLLRRFYLRNSNSYKGISSPLSPINYR